MRESDLLEKWIELAKADLKAADQLTSGGNLLLSMFHLQQAVEKYLKAYFVKKLNTQPPYIHNLVSLAKEASLTEVLSEEQKDLLDELNPYYIKARYPTVKKQLSDSLNRKKVESSISKTKEFLVWLELKLK